MSRKTLLVIAACMVVSLFATSSPAHHSMTGYDRSHTTTMRATITDFNWTNPHVEAFFQVSRPSGTVEKWMGEMPGPGRLERNGWSRETLKSGDQVTITGNIAKDGSPGMRLLRVVLPDGRELSAYGY